jgi:hypothetical protein
MHQGPAVQPFGLRVEAARRTMARSWPELLSDSPVIEAAADTQLPVTITWQTGQGDAFLADLTGTSWTIVPTDGQRSEQPLALADGQSSALAFSQQASLILTANLAVPAKPGWYQVFLNGRAVRQSDQAALEAGANAFRLFVPYASGSVRTGEITPVPAGVVTRDGITLQVERVQMTEQFTLLTYHIALPAAVHAPIGHDLRLAIDQGAWMEPVTVGEREGAADADGYVRSVSGQAIFPPLPMAASNIMLQIPSLDVVVSSGGAYGSVQSMPGPWSVQFRIPSGP